MNRLLIFLLAALSVTASATLHGQEYPMLHYTLNDGLPSNTVYQVFRDSKGFLWLATDKGVARYNGVKFEKFNSFNGLADNEVFYFTEDLYGRIWLGSYNGELCYFQNDTFHTASNTPFLNLPVRAAFIKTIISEKDSSVTFAFNDRTFILNNKKDKWTIIPVRSDTEYTGLYARKLNKLDYIIYYSSRPERHTQGKKIIQNATGKIKSITRTRYIGGVWMIFNQKQSYFVDSNSFFDEDEKFIKSSAIKFSDMRKPYTFYDDGKNYFIGMRDGLYINDTIHLLKGKWVVTVMQDNYGNYWVGTHNDGLYCISKNFTNTYISEHAYNGIALYTQAGRNNIFFATNDNTLYSIESKIIRKVFSYPEYTGVPAAQTDDAGWLIDNNNNYYNLYDRNGIVINNVLSGTSPVQLYTTKFLSYEGVKPILAAGSYLYIRINQNIFRIHTSQFYRGYVGFEHIMLQLGKDRIFCMEQSKDSSIWCATLKNIYKITGDKSILQPQFKGVTLKSMGFYGNYMIGCTHHNQMVVCSNFEDKIHIDTVAQQNCIWEKLYRINDTCVLISTDNLYRILTLHPGNIKHPYSIGIVEDLLIPTHVETVCCDSKYCYFFSGGTVISMNIQNLLEKAAAPRLEFRNLKTAKHTYMIGADLSLPFAEAKNITISFSTLSEWGNEITYQYSVSKNGEQEWRNVAGQDINLISPSYGNYVISLRAKTISTDYCTPIELKLHILPPVWATTWFILLCIAGCMVLAYVIFRLRIFYLLQKNKKEHENEMKFMKSEYKALNALMNPHFIFNAMNNVQSLFNENDKMAANTYLRVFADLIRQNMHNVSKEVITLQKEMDLVINYLRLEKLRFEDKLDFTINIEDALDLSEITVPPLLIQPIVENSIKHGILPLQGITGVVSINIYEKEDHLYIDISDNGVGISTNTKQEDARHESYGLENIKKRIKQISMIHGKEMLFSIEDTKDAAGNISGTIATVIISLA